jgi:hypothetical protein
MSKRTIWKLTGSKRYKTVAVERLHGDAAIQRVKREAHAEAFEFDQVAALVKELAFAKRWKVSMKFCY